MKCNNAVLLVFATVVAVFSGQVLGLPLIACNPVLLGEVPQNIRQACAALFRLNELKAVMENYVSNKALHEGVPLIDSGVKRQDIDHVFLRFGRRR